MSDSTATGEPAAQSPRARVGAWLFARVAGPQGPANRDRIHNAPGPRWFGPDRPIRRVHGDAAMFVGGLRALLFQSLHPLAMAAVDAHSGYRGDPWGRLQRTSTFMAVTTYGADADATRAVERVRGVHARVHGTTPDGRDYRADDPHLLGWVHVAEVESFLQCHQRYGKQPLDRAERDAYVADTARVAEALGVVDPPRDMAELHAWLSAYRPELKGTPEARDTARFLLRRPPLPAAVRPAYAALAAGAVAELPPWARRELALIDPAGLGSVIGPVAGHTVVRGVRWAMAANRPKH
ncbi:oxygenase MpaB family protein [Nocardiopsis nanhaiensis]